MPKIFTPIRYFAYKHKLVGFFQNTSVFSADEVSTLYHLPDITYNKSPLISWLGYKKLPVPHNLKVPSDPTMLEEEVTTNDASGNPIKTRKVVHRHLG